MRSVVGALVLAMVSMGCSTTLEQRLEACEHVLEIGEVLTHEKALQIANEPVCEGVVHLIPVH